MTSAQLYDSIGATYTVTRRTDPRIAARIWEALGDARTVLNVGAGAGSPAEINLREGDIANMGFARAAGVSVVRAGYIDRGGVIAALIRNGPAASATR